MNFNLKDHFELSKIEKLKDSKTKVFFYIHKKTGASVLFFDNLNPNAGFGTFFKTPAINSKGTTHILEHCVFEGSKKYNKENSMQYIQDTSLVSDCNAMTYPDKTIYYFCSSFEKDFLNVLDIYTDFMFFPLLEEKTLKKEGHFFKKTSEGHEFNGIVFNEMKKYLLDFESTSEQVVSKLFNNGTYEFNSGGEPLDIVDLTIDELRDYHKNHYHPSNSYTIIYGKINKNKVFNKLNEVFSKFEKTKPNNSLNANPIEENKKISVSYQSYTDEDKIFSKYYLFKNIKTEEDFHSLSLLRKYLLSFNFSPLLRLLEDSNLCLSVNHEIISDIKYPILYISCKGVKEQNIDKLEKLLDEGFEKFTKKISKEIKDMLLKRSEYKYNEIEFYQNQAVDTILHAANFLNNGLDPLTIIREKDSLKVVKKILKGKNLENFAISTLKEAKTLSVTFNPDKNLIREYEEKLRIKLEKKLHDLDLAKLDAEIAEHEKFLSSKKASTNYPDLKKIKYKDLNIEIPKFENEFKEKLFKTYLNSGEIVRCEFMFDLTKLSPDKYVLLGIYLSLINQISTKNTNFEELSLQKGRNFSHITFQSSDFYNYHIDKQYFVFKIDTKFLASDFDNVSKILKDIISDISFKDKERIKFLLNEKLTYISENLQNKVLGNAIDIALSYLNPLDKIEFSLSSLPLKFELRKILADYENNFEKLSHDLADLHKFIYSNSCFINLGVSKEVEDKVSKDITNLSKELEIRLTSIYDFEGLKTDFFNKLKDSISIFYESVSPANFNIMGFNLKKINLDYLPVITIIRDFINQYLWQEIRVKNGAYGSYLWLIPEKNFGFFYSVADPKINETFKVYLNNKNLYNLKKFNKKMFEKLKVKFLAEEKVILRNSEIFTNSFNNYIRQISDSEREENLKRKFNLNFDEFKKLLILMVDFESTVKVIACSKENIVKFNDKYEKIDLD